jgi:hypothetical protein
MHRRWPSEPRGRRECRALNRTRSLACNKRKHASKSPQVRRNIRHSPRDGLRLMACSPRGTGLDSPRRLQAFARRLDTSVGVSGPHDFVVRLPCRSPRDTEASIAPYPNVRDDWPKRPSWWDRMRASIHLIWASGKAKFLRKRIERPERLETVRENRALAQQDQGSAVLSRMKHSMWLDLTFIKVRHDFPRKPSKAFPTPLASS